MIEKNHPSLTGWTDARKTWGFGLCFLHLRNVKGHPWNHKQAAILLFVTTIILT